MSLRLLNASPGQGVAWISRGFSTFLKRPLGFTALFVGFLFGALVLMAIPYAGAMLLLAALPLLTLGSMIATRSALAGGPVSPLQLVEPLRPDADAQRRRSLLVLCALYAATTAVLMLGADRLDGGGFERLQILLASARSDARNKEIDALLADPRLFNGMLLRLGGSALLSVPFWHAPALVWWHGQGVAQSLFSSTLACWRNKGAFVVYGLAWLATSATFLVVAGALFALMGAPQLAGVAAAPGVLIFSVAFYASLYFTYADSFAEN